jgi:hypothetical protein
MSKLDKKIFRVSVPLFILMAIMAGPYSQALGSASASKASCSMANHCCCPMMDENADVMPDDCGCKVDKIPDLPGLPEGVEASQGHYGHNISLVAAGLPIPIKPADDHVTAQADEPESANNSPPLYILNASYLI